MIQPVHYLQFEVTFARDELQPGSSPPTHRTSCSTRMSHNMRACGMQHVATPSLQEVIDILATGLLHHRYRRWSTFWLLASTPSLYKVIEFLATGLLHSWPRIIIPSVCQHYKPCEQIRTFLFLCYTCQHSRSQPIHHQACECFFYWKMAIPVLCVSIYLSIATRGYNYVALLLTGEHPLFRLLDLEHLNW